MYGFHLLWFNVVLGEMATATTLKTTQVTSERNHFIVIAIALFVNVHMLMVKIANLISLVKLCELKNLIFMFCGITAFVVSFIAVVNFFFVHFKWYGVGFCFLWLEHSVHSIDSKCTQQCAHSILMGLFFSFLSFPSTLSSLQSVLTAFELLLLLCMLISIDTFHYKCH